MHIREGSSSRRTGRGLLFFPICRTLWNWHIPWKILNLSESYSFEFFSSIGYTFLLQLIKNFFSLKSTYQPKYLKMPTKFNEKFVYLFQASLPFYLQSIPKNDPVWAADSWRSKMNRFCSFPLGRQKSQKMSGLKMFTLHFYRNVLLEQTSRNSKF